MSKYLNSATQKFLMLGLKLPTDPRWVHLAEMKLEDILTDHAYCEQKAASSGISMIQSYPEFEELVDQITPLVSEEWSHFKMVIQELKIRNLRLGRQRKDEYVNKLRLLIRKSGNRHHRMMDDLLTNALIEARSCERFRLLSEGLEDESLRNFYRQFMESEAGHYRMFKDLAEKYCGKEETNKRWLEFLEYEKEILAQLELRGDRMH